MNGPVSRADMLRNAARMMGVSLDDPTSGLPAVDWTSIDTSIKHEGKEIILPNEPGPMDYDDAINTIARIRDQENQEFDVKELIGGAPWDCAVAVYRAMQELYGVVLSESIQTFFGPIRPDFLTVHTGHRDEDRVQVPIGQVSLPGVSKPIMIELNRLGVVIGGVVRKRDRAVLVRIANKAREMLRTQSVYKTKSVRFGVDEGGNLQLNVQPEFIDLTSVKEADMIHNPETEALIKTSIFSPLKNTAACRKHRIPLKRGVLLSGRYGTGKSLTARVTAKVANDNGWTFIMLDRSQGLKAAIEFAKNYQPCVIFAEDIDRAADRAKESVNDLVNMLDGLITKDMEMMVVLTTNHLESIDQALLRPGRFDAVISILPPDGPTAERIIRMYARDLLAADADLSPVHPLIDGNIPAMLREVVERAKLSMLGEDREQLSVDDLYVSALGMKHHMELLAPPAKQKSVGTRFGDVFIELMAGAALGIDTDSIASTHHIEAAVQSLAMLIGDVNTNVGQTKSFAKAGAGAAEESRKVGHAILKEVK